MSDTQQTKVTGHTTRAMVMVSHTDHHMAGSQVQRQMSGLHIEGAQTSWAELGQAQLKLGCLASPHSQPGSSSLRVIKRKKDLTITISNLVITIFFFQGFCFRKEESSHCQKFSSIVKLFNNEGHNKEGQLII